MEGKPLKSLLESRPHLKNVEVKPGALELPQGGEATSGVDVAPSGEESTEEVVVEDAPMLPTTATEEPTATEELTVQEDSTSGEVQEVELEGRRGGSPKVDVLIRDVGVMVTYPHLGKS